MLKKLFPTSVLTGLAFILSGCINGGPHPRITIEPQVYDFRNIDPNLELPKKLQKSNTGWNVGIMQPVDLFADLSLTGGVDLRFNQEDDCFNEGQCHSDEDHSRIGQKVLTPIPFVGLEQQFDNFSLFLEASLPYSSLFINSEGGPNYGLIRTVESSLGKKISIGFRHSVIRRTGDVIDSGTHDKLGIYFTYEKHETSIVDINIFGVGFSYTF